MGGGGGGGVDFGCPMTRNLVRKSSVYRLNEIGTW